MGITPRYGEIRNYPFLGFGAGEGEDTGEEVSVGEGEGADVGADVDEGEGWP
jgi:hypothetical protein